MKLNPTNTRAGLPGSVRTRVFQTFALAASFAFGAWIVSDRILAQTTPQPVLRISPTNSTQVLISITNAVASTNYEIYRTPILNDTNFPWELYIVGSAGQSNFTADIGVDWTGFFKAGIGSDWDLDGVPNSQDANPTDSTIVILSITIDSPTNGSVLQ